jgi:DNA-binding NtrC family response regulator
MCTGTRDDCSCTPDLAALPLLGQHNVPQPLFIQKDFGFIHKGIRMMKPRLLLIEDDAAVQTLLVELLDYAGYDTSVAMPDDYLFMMVEVQPDILMLGCDGDHTFSRGWQIAATARRRRPDLVIIMLSTNRAVVAEVGRTTRGKVFSAGIEKPFAIEDLLQTIASCYCEDLSVHVE